MTELHDSDPVDPEIIDLFEKLRDVADGHSRVVVLTAMGIMLHDICEGDHGHIVVGLQMIGNTAANIEVETMN